MSEYIITDRQLKTATEAYLEHELSRPITEVFISGDKLPEIVRCMDCANASFDEFGGGWCNENCREIKPWDFCAWSAKVVERWEANT